MTGYNLRTLVVGIKVLNHIERSLHYRGDEVQHGLGEKRSGSLGERQRGSRMLVIH